MFDVRCWVFDVQRRRHRLPLVPKLRLGTQLGASRAERDSLPKAARRAGTAVPGNLCFAGGGVCGYAHAPARGHSLRAKQSFAHSGIPKQSLGTRVTRTWKRVDSRRHRSILHWLGFPSCARYANKSRKSSRERLSTRPAGMKLPSCFRSVMSALANFVSAPVAGSRTVVCCGSRAAM